MCTVARRVRWSDLMRLRFDAPTASLPFAVEPVESMDRLVTVPGIEALLSIEDDKVGGVWWATDLAAVKRVLYQRVAEDGGAHRLDPPAELLPRGADRQGTFGSVARSLRSQRMAHGVVGSYTRSGRWNYREMATGMAGFSYMYRQRGGDTDPVAVISIRLARADWVPDRGRLRRGSSGRSPLASLRELFKKKPSLDPGRRSWGESLLRSGLWSGLPEAVQMDRLTRLSNGEQVVDTLDDLGWPADGEDLAEGTVETLLKSMKPALAKRDVRLRVKTIDSPHRTGSPGYAIEVNGEIIDLYRLNPSEPSLPLSEDPWLDCTMLPLRRVNELLAEVGSGDRVVIFEPGGNDGFAILATPAVLESLLAAPTPTERPVMP